MYKKQNIALDKIEKGLLDFYTENNSEEYIKAMEEDKAGLKTRMEQYTNITKRILFKAKARENKTFMMEVEEKHKNSDTFRRLKKLLEDGSKNIIAIFNQYVKEKGVSVNYRNLDKMNEDEIKDILLQLDLTTLLNDIEENTDE